MLSKNRTLRLVLFAAPALALTAAALFLAFGPGSGRPAQADFPHPGLDLSLAIAAANCDSSGAQTTCDVPAGGTFQLDFKLNTLPADMQYDGYDSVLNFDIVSIDTTTTAQTGAGVWPNCVFATGLIAQGPGLIVGGCGIGLPPAPHSTYIGVLYHVNGSCPSPAPAMPGHVSLAKGQGNTSLTDPNAEQHGEDGHVDSLTVTCGASGNATNTPAPATNTPMPPTNTPTGPANTPAPATNTPTTGPTNTPRPTNTPTATRAISRCDVNGDGHITSEDGLWILWKEADIVDHVPLPENADCNHDGIVNSIDALFAVWIEGGRIPAPA